MTKLHSYALKAKGGKIAFMGIESKRFLYTLTLTLTNIEWGQLLKDLMILVVQSILKG